MNLRGLEKRLYLPRNVQGHSDTLWLAISQNIRGWRIKVQFCPSLFLFKKNIILSDYSEVKKKTFTFFY